jgi:hypothetical protein
MKSSPWVEIDVVRSLKEASGSRDNVEGVRLSDAVIGGLKSDIGLESKVKSDRFQNSARLVLFS